MFTAYRDLYIRLVAETSPSSVPIRPAATVVLVRDGAAGVEVLMVRRDRKAVFMSGAHVFPGGAVDEVDHGVLARGAVTWSGDASEFSWRAAGLRELFEEVGVLVGSQSQIDRGLEGADLYGSLVALGEHLDADALEYIGNWVTPVGPSRRFDARFYVTTSTGNPIADDREVFDAVWVRPSDALAAVDRGEWLLEFPTRATLATFLHHATVSELMVDAAALEVERIAPRLATAEDGTIEVLLPGDQGFDEALA